jgi:H+-translocating NAD(P) transhydrogenase subunit alpha
MFVNIAVLKETEPHERRVALVPSIARLIALGAKLHMQAGAGDGVDLPARSLEDGSRH